MSNYEEKDTQEYQQNMPSKGLFTFWLVLGFVTGVLWGLLAISPYSKMNKAIAANDSYDAWANAKKVRMFAPIGIAVNVVFILISLGINK